MTTPSTNRQKRGFNTRRLVVCGLLTAITVLFGFTPLGFIPLPGMKITLMCLPVIIGAILEGPIVGLILGAIFAGCSLISAVTAPSLFSPLFLSDPILIAVIPRLMVGIVAWLVYKGLQKLTHDKDFISVPVAAALGTLTNTVLLLGAIYVFHGAECASLMGGDVAAAGVALAGIAVSNGIPEAIASVIIVTAVVLAIKKVGKRKPAAPQKQADAQPKDE